MFTALFTRWDPGYSKLLHLNSYGLRHVLGFFFAFITFQRAQKWTRRLWTCACLNWPLAQVKGKWSLDLAADAGVNLKVHQGNMLGPSILSADVKFAQLVGLWLVMGWGDEGRKSQSLEIQRPASNNLITPVLLDCSGGLALKCCSFLAPFFFLFFFFFKLNQSLISWVRLSKSICVVKSPYWPEHFGGKTFMILINALSLNLFGFPSSVSFPFSQIFLCVAIHSQIEVTAQLQMCCISIKSRPQL